MFMHCDDISLEIHQEAIHSFAILPFPVLTCKPFCLFEQIFYCFQFHDTAMVNDAIP